MYNFWVIMLKVNGQKLLLFLISIFFLCASLLGTTQVDDDRKILKTYSIPDFFGEGVYFFYVFLLIVFSLIGLFSLYKNLYFNRSVLLLVLAYMVLVFWSLVTSSDQLRYISIFAFIFLCPVGILYLMEKVDFKSLSKYLFTILVSLLLLSLFFSILNFPTHPRISGVYNNPNLFGMWLFSILSLLLYIEKSINNIFILLTVALIVVLVILTGSRLSFVTTCLLLLPFIFKHRVFSLLVLLVFTLYFFIGDNSFSLRVTEVGSAVSDSGRIDIWNRAFQCIDSEPLLGHGMFGHINCVNIGNIHNSYLRIVVMLGFPLAFIFFTLFLGFIVKVTMMQVNLYIKFYFLGLPLLFFAEDYIVGIASPFFPILIFMLALLLLDLKNKKIYLKEI